MSTMTAKDEIINDIAGVRRDVTGLHAEVVELRRTLIGSYDKPGGLAVAVVTNQRDIALLQAELAKHQVRRDELVKEYDARLAAVEDWVKAIKNRAIGVVVGVSLGSAGIGAGVATLISNLIGG